MYPVSGVIQRFITYPRNFKDYKKNTCVYVYINIYIYTRMYRYTYMYVRDGI